MTSRVSSVTTWRRIIIASMVALIAMLGIVATSPGTASAAPLTATQAGWVYVRAAPVYSACARDAYCRTYVGVYQWSGYGWRNGLSARRGVRVYAYPFSGQWHWAWTQQTGWLAIPTQELSTDGY